MKMKYLYMALGNLAFAAVGSTVYAADYLAEGRDAFLNYDFELASELYAKYAKSIEKHPDAEGEKLLETYRRQLEIAESSLDNVQKMEIIDRLDVPVGDFVSYIPIPSNEGSLLPKDQLPFKKRNNDSDFIFSSSSGDCILWSESDENGLTHIYESSRLVDGSWEKPQSAGDVLNDGGNVRNPFMLTDGMTLYFAGDGDGTMGGMDLFVASKDPATGKYRQPMGLGYPFNSPYNEYMMAIDEENGIGWWVTDRNQIDGKVSVYVFYTNDIRKNYTREDEDDIIELARINDISITQNPEKDYSQVVAAIKKRGSRSSLTKDADVIFRLPGNRAIRQVSDLTSSVARRNLTQFLSAEAEFKSNCSKLESLRKKYHSANGGRNASQALRNQISDLEKTVEWQRDKLKKMRNSVISAETQH